MTKKETIYNILKVSISNLLKLFSGVMVGFLLPKIIGVSDYGYYKTFTLYAAYVGLFHFGIADGIYLKYGDKDYDELNKKAFRYYSKYLLVIEICISIVIAVLSSFLLTGELRFIFICVAIYLTAINITSYYQFISQITNRFNELSIRNIISSVLTIMILVFMAVVKRLSASLLSYRIYLIMYVMIVIILAAWYIYTYKDITFGETEKLKNSVIKEFIMLGFPLMLSSLCTSLILTIDRQFVSILFDINTYAIYAFAYSMLSLVTTAVSAISTVLYPTLKRADEDSFIKAYEKLVAGIQILIFGCLLLYFPLVFIVKSFLPQYLDSLVIFRIIFPGLVMSSVITIVIHNYYKTIGWNSKFFIKSIITLGISFLANMIAYVIFKTTESISVASIITLVLWYLIVEFDLVKQYKVRWKRNLLYVLMMSFVFYLITSLNNIILSSILYIIGFLCISASFYINSHYFNFKELIRKNKRGM